MYITDSFVTTVTHNDTRLFDIKILVIARRFCRRGNPFSFGYYGLLRCKTPRNDTR